MTHNQDNSNDQLDQEAQTESPVEFPDELAGLLNGRVPLDVPADVSSSIRLQMTSELSATTAAEQQSAARRFRSSKAGRWLLSFEFLVPALIVACLGGNFAVVWSSDQRIAAVVGDHEQPPDISHSPRQLPQLQLAEANASTLFQMNISLIQRELRYEQSESFRLDFSRQRQAETRSPTAEKNAEKVPDHSGAAVAPCPGIQRSSELAGCFRV